MAFRASPRSARYESGEGSDPVNKAYDIGVSVALENGESYDTTVHQYLTQDAVNAYQPGGKFQIKADPATPARSCCTDRPSPAFKHLKAFRPGALLPIGNWRPMPLLASITDFFFEWYPVFGSSSPQAPDRLRVLLRTTMGRPNRRRFKASKTGPVLWDEVQGVDAARRSWSTSPSAQGPESGSEALGARSATRRAAVRTRPARGRRCWPARSPAHAGVDFFAASGSSFVEMFVGRGAARIRRLFKEARGSGRAVVLSTSSTRSGPSRLRSGRRRHSSEAGPQPAAGGARRVRARPRHRDRPGGSNQIEKLDKALLRPGRFDRQVLVAPRTGRARGDPPLARPRQDALRKVDLLGRRPQDPGVDRRPARQRPDEAAIIAGRAGGWRSPAEDLDRSSVASVRRLTAVPPADDKSAGSSPTTRGGTRSAAGSAGSTLPRSSASCRAGPRWASSRTHQRGSLTCARART